jgi:hypothetical protein
MMGGAVSAVQIAACVLRPETLLMDNSINRRRRIIFAAHRLSKMQKHTWWCCENGRGVWESNPPGTAPSDPPAVLKTVRPTGAPTPPFNDYRAYCAIHFECCQATISAAMRQHNLTCPGGLEAPRRRLFVLACSTPADPIERLGEYAAAGSNF